MNVRAEQPAVEWPQALVDAHASQRRDLERVATLILGSRAEAEDIVQDSFVAVAHNWSRVEHLAAYLRQTVVNRSRAVLRRRDVAERHRPEPAPPGAPDQLIELRDVLMALPARQRAVIALRFIDGLDDHEIAATLDCRLGTVRSLRTRGLRTIRRALT